LISAICDEDDECPGDEDNTCVTEVFNNTHYCVTRWIALRAIEPCPSLIGIYVDDGIKANYSLNKKWGHTH
jgi:hypothetical protein